jgi:hypothetical protein
MSGVGRQERESAYETEPGQLIIHSKGVRPGMTNLGVNRIGRASAIYDAIRSSLSFYE